MLEIAKFSSDALLEYIDLILNKIVCNDRSIRVYLSYSYTRHYLLIVLLEYIDLFSLFDCYMSALA